MLFRSAVEVGENFACMLKQAGNMPVKCWGTSVNGRLGYENTEALGDSSSDNLASVVDLGLDSEYESVDCGGADPFLHDTNILPAEELDNSGNGRKIDIAFRSDGCPGVLYTDDNANNLRFAMYDNESFCRTIWANRDDSVCFLPLIDDTAVSFLKSCGCDTFA